MGDIPLMTPRGTFVVNGIERVVVNQMHRSPIFLDHDKGKGHSSGKLYSIVSYTIPWFMVRF